ncbi:hypothetical protein [uncultured Cohaesibacter sp.]|uniref:hypothetical protein n=1 Tax=uncultured Cohaesibacter sp. TaxID=1002546 RepID=UPI0029C8B74B|nr:hypothetical protein [uncultured Cohaesibacter sp.]
MKNLCINMRSTISVRNFSEGMISCKEITAEQVASFIASARRDNAEIMGLYDFGTEITDQRCQDLRDLLVAFETVTGTYLSEDAFFEEPDEDGDAFPIVDCTSMVNETCSMLVVEYYFTFNCNVNSLNFRDSISVTHDDMVFYLFERQ